MPRLRPNGFSLVELMVVIALMSLFAGATVLAATTVGSSASDAAGRFASRVAAARDASIVTGRPISAWVTASGYGFDQLQDGYWRPLAEKPFDGANWDQGTAVTFASGDQGRGRIRFDPLGLPDQPLSVRLTADGRAVEVRIAPTGDVTVE